MKGKVLLIAALTSVYCVGCATPYQRQGLTGGFSDTQLDENVFQVSFKGNAHTDRERADDFALLRCAEVTLEKGYTFFVIVDAQQYSKHSSYTTPSTATTNMNATTYGTPSLSNTYGTATTTFSGGQTYQMSKPRTTKTIILFKDKPVGFSYNAEFLARSLRQKYNIGAPSQ